MMKKGTYAPALGLPPLLLAPSVCFAQTLSAWVGLFNIMVGLMLVAAFLFYGAGLIVWAVRLNTFPTNRDFAIELLQWAVTILFVLIILLFIVQFTQDHARDVLIVLGILVVFFVTKLVLSSTGSSGEKEEH
jgi:hypothetical protein